MSAQRVWGALVDVTVCCEGRMAAGRWYLPSQPGGSSVAGTWTGSPRRGGGGGEARGVSEGHVVAGQHERGFNVEGRGIGVRRSGMRGVTHWAVFGKVQAARLGVGVYIE